MARAIWTGHISFGLVEIPVSLVKADDPHELDLHMVDRRDHAPIGYERINKNTGEPVAWEDIVKAHDAGGDLVLLSESELANANAETVKRIEILEFVDGASIHPAYFEKPYYLEPARKHGSKAYALLRATLERTGKVGIATVVLRSRQHLAALTTRDAALVLVLLRFADELRDVEGLELPGEGKDTKVAEKELAMAEQLVASMDAEWDPTRYHDAYFEDVMNLIARKREAGETEPLEVAEPPTSKGTPVIDLVRLLKESVEGRSERAEAKPAHRRASRAKKAHARSGGTRTKRKSESRTTRTRKSA